MREGWELKKWEDVLEIRSGRNQKDVENPEGQYPIYGSGGTIMNYADDYICEEGTTIIGRKGTIDNPILIKTKFWNVDTAFGLVAGNELDKKFLFYFCLSFDFTSRDKGTTLPSLVKKDLIKIKMPIPQLPEQKRIVEILDQAFEAIDQARDNVERNIQNAEELFQSKLNEIFSQRGDGWVSNKLKDITTKIGSGATPRGGKKNYKESGISLIRSMNVYDRGFEKEKLAFIDETQAEKLSNVELEKGDVLLNITGASVARCCIVPDEFLPARVNQHVSIIRLADNTMDERFLHYALLSKPYKDHLLGIGEQGATRQAITKAQIQNFMISYPTDMGKQRELIETIDEFKDVSNSLTTTYKTKFESLDELKKSILQKAFSGELTTNEHVAA